MKKINIFMFNDENFLEYYQKTRAKGLFKFTVEGASASAITMVIMNIYYMKKGVRLFGFEKGDPFIVALAGGLIIGLMCSLIFWAMDNYRYNQIQKKNSFYKKNEG